MPLSAVVSGFLGAGSVLCSMLVVSRVGIRGEVEIDTAHLSDPVLIREDGRFLLRGLSPGQHGVHAETADGRSAEAKLTLPGGGVDLVLGKAKSKR